jgi:vancomycin resistance protein YoaR
LTLLPLALGGAGLAYLGQLPPPQVRLAGFATRLADRSPAQRHNARLAANALDGAVIPPGGAFSFNKRVNSWSVDQGYVKAPVSFDGELLPAFGGGVCQTSTTLYNAALLAGLGIAERHHHVFAPHYVAPGRDAAVAYPNIDLRLSNPYPFPLRLRARATGDRLSVEVWGKEAPRERYVVEGRVLSETPAVRVVRHVPAPTGGARTGRRFARTAGAAGFRVVTYRRTLAPGGAEARRERLSDDSYPAMPEVVRFADAGTGR